MSPLLSRLESRLGVGEEAPLLYPSVPGLLPPTIPHSLLMLFCYSFLNISEKLSEPLGTETEEGEEQILGSVSLK